MIPNRPINGNSALGAPALVPAETAAWMHAVRVMVGALHYGTVEITVQNSEVVQVESTSKVRLDLPILKAYGHPARRRHPGHY
jgi:hypothetical protein